MAGKSLSAERGGAVHRHIGARLRQAREQTGLSLRDSAARVGAPAARLAAFERGAARLTARNLFQLAAALGKPLVWFFEDMPEAVTSGPAGAPATLTRPGWTAETQALIDAFQSIPNPGTRHEIILLLRGIAAELQPR